MLCFEPCPTSAGGVSPGGKCASLERPEGLLGREAAEEWVMPYSSILPPQPELELGWCPEELGVLPSQDLSCNTLPLPQAVSVGGLRSPVDGGEQDLQG